MIPKIIAPPETEPLTIEECRAHLEVQPYVVDTDGVGTHPHDDMIMAMQGSAREFCELFTGLAIGQQTLEIALDAFPSAEIELPRPPVVAIVSVKYYDADEILQTLADNLYVLDNYQLPGWLLPSIGTTWPATLGAANAVKVRYLAGYGVTSDGGEPLPYAIRAAMLLMLGHLYANRESVAAGTIVEVPLGVEALLRPLRIRLGMA